VTYLYNSYWFGVHKCKKNLDKTINELPESLLNKNGSFGLIKLNALYYINVSVFIYIKNDSSFIDNLMHN